MTVPRILIIAGSDSGGGAGIQADIKTVTMLGGHAMTAITAITAQNTVGVDAVELVSTAMVMAQIDAVVRDIGIDAVKIGMIGSAETANAVADWLQILSVRTDTSGPNGVGTVPIVFDPVMVATSGSVLADGDTIAAFERLVRVATVTTPNLPELEALGGESVAARMGAAILVKGGHGEGPALVDRLIGPDGDMARWEAPRIETRATHGTGCTLASAIATGLGRGESLADAIDAARMFVRSAMKAGPGLGAGHGSLGHRDGATGMLDMNQVTMPATDYAASVRFYRRLGLRQIVDSPARYARFETPGGGTLSIEVGLGAAGAARICLECGDLDARVARLADDGVVFDEGPVDQRWGWREARLTDPAGNRILLYRAGENRRFPPWRIA